MFLLLYYLLILLNHDRIQILNYCKKKNLNVNNNFRDFSDLNNNINIFYKFTFATSVFYCITFFNNNNYS